MRQRRADYFLRPRYFEIQRLLSLADDSFKLYLLQLYHFIKLYLNTILKHLSPRLIHFATKK